MSYWLVKTEPEEYSFDMLISNGKTIWDGVRNYQARNNLRLMKKGDIVFVYHSGKNKDIVGLSKVIKESYNDPKDKTGTWCVIELESLKKLNFPVTLNKIKESKELSKLPLLKQRRLSVMLVSKEEFKYILKLGKTEL